MAYSSSTEVEADFKNLTFGTTGNCTTSEVEQFIQEADALIDSYVGMRYTVPVVASGSGLDLLKLFSRSLAAERVRAILQVKQGTGTQANQNVRDSLLSYKDVIAQLERIAKGEVTLDGATALVSGGGFYSRNYANSETPVMKKNCKQW